MSQLSTGSSQLSVSSQRSIRMKSSSVLGCLGSPVHSRIVCHSKRFESSAIGHINSQSASGDSMESDLHAMVAQNHGKTADLHHAAVPVSFSKRIVVQNNPSYTKTTTYIGSSTARCPSYAMNDDNNFSNLQNIANKSLTSSSSAKMPEINTIRCARTNPTKIGAAYVNQTGSSREMSLFRISGSSSENPPTSALGVAAQQNAVTDFVNLIDIPIAYYGVISQLRPTTEYLRHQLVKPSRDCFCLLMEKIVENSLDSGYWKKLFLFPVIAFAKTSTTVTLQNLSRIKNDLWHELKVQDFIQFNFGQRNEAPDAETWDKVHSHAYKCITRGHLSKAYRVLCENAPPAPRNMQTLQKLESKHPQEPHAAEEDLIRAMRSFRVPDESKLVVSAEQLRIVINRGKSAIQPGVDKLRYEHLQALAGKGGEADADEWRFCSLLAKVITLILNGDFPDEVAPLVRDNMMTAISKGADDVRPIGIGTMYRKLASLVAFHSLREFNDEHFQRFQYGLRHSGCESIIHTLRLRMEQHEGYDLFAMDADNAFNRANRMIGLQQVMVHTPYLLPMLRHIYLCDSNCWYTTDDTVSAIHSKHGYHQGDVLASWLYILTIQPLLQLIDDTITQEFPDNHYYQGWYVDDGNIHAPRDVMYRIIEILQQRGPEYGYNIKRNKGKYLMSKCNSVVEAARVKQDIIDRFGFSENVVMVHYRDVNNGLEYKSRYGAKVLGAYVGTDEFIQRSLMDDIAELNAVADRLIAFPDLQGRLLLLRHCFAAKPTYLMRTMTPHMLRDYIPVFEGIKKRIVASVFGYAQVQDIPNDVYSLFNLNIRNGGLGMHMAEETADAAFVSSMVDYHTNHGECFEYLCVGQHDIMNLLPYVQQFVDVSRKFIGDNGTRGILSMRNVIGKDGGTVQHQLQQRLVEQRIETLKRQWTDRPPPDLPNGCKLLWFNSLRNDESGKFLEVKPTTKKLVIVNSVFRALLRYRYMLPVEGLVCGMKCTCRVRGVSGGPSYHPAIDACGHHIVSGCGSDGNRNDIHDNVVLELDSILKYCGKATRREERGAFALADGSRNRLRPDISILNPTGTIHAKLLLDIGITSPFQGVTSGQLKHISVVDANQPGMAANSYFASKQRKYETLANDNNYSFLPLIMETSGLMHPEFKLFLERLASTASDVKRIKKSILYNYFLKRISLRFQVALGSALVKRVSLLAPHDSAIAKDPLFSKAVIVEQEMNLH